MDPTLYNQLSTRDRQILRDRGYLLFLGRDEHEPFAPMFLAGMAPPHPADTNPSEPRDTLYPGFRQRQRLQKLERLEDMDRDTTLQAFQDSDVQRQLGSGMEQQGINAYF